MACFPLIYLQHRVFWASSPGGTPAYKNTTAIHKSLENFYAVKQQRLQNLKSRSKVRPKILTAYLEPTDSLNMEVSPLPTRNTESARLKKVTFPMNHDRCSRLMEEFPVDDFPMEDPFLPWIHDYFPSTDRKYVQFVAQNRRRCDTGEDHEHTMKFWEPQIALFQPVPVIAQEDGLYRLAPNLDTATHKETRFQCHFHTADDSHSATTLSEFPFNYEYMNWRKGRNPMLSRSGKDTSLYWLSQLLFKCPIPSEFQKLLLADSYGDKPSMYLDLVPIRTPARVNKVLLTVNHTGIANLPPATVAFDPARSFGESHYLPEREDAGRWANLPVCRWDKTGPTVPKQQQKPHRLVACTWTASSYARRGDTLTISDSAKRLEEWIHFHLLVGFDHLYIYDNSDLNSTDLKTVVRNFSSKHVTYHRWPCRVCNNNRPAHKNPGERSSQYAAEASCRERYGPLTEWMSFIDTDEYLVPMKANKKGEYNWNPVLDEMDENNIAIMKLLSSRGLPRVDLMEVMEDQSTCVDPNVVRGANRNKTEPCIGLNENTTFLQVYNCDYIRPPKPERFGRAMKQIYRPSHVYSHFVHYSTVTANVAETYSEFIMSHSDPKKFILNARDPRFEAQSPELFLDELTQGALVHARSILPHETRRRSAECYSKSTFKCMLGYPCEDTVPFSDVKHKDNSFQNPDRNFCNCWRNPVVQDVLAPQLLARLRRRH